MKTLKQWLGLCEHELEKDVRIKRRVKLTKKQNKLIAEYFNKRGLNIK